MSFEACYRRGRHVPIGDIMLKLIDIDDLKANKRAAGRPRDIADLDALGDS